MHSIRTLTATTAWTGATGDRKKSMRPGASCRHPLMAAHRHAATPGPSVLSCQAIDRLAEWEAKSFVCLRSPPMVESISITSTISGAWTSSDKLHLEDLVTLCSNGSESVRTWQQG